MEILLRNIQITDPSSTFNGAIVDVLIEGGSITKIEPDIKIHSSYQVQDHSPWHMAPGLFDMGVWNGEPGFEHRETIKSLVQVATSGGFTDIALFPNTIPATDHRSAIRFIRDKSEQAPIELHAYGAVSENTKGLELAEIMDMQAEGAVAFTDGINPIHAGGLLLRALQYVKSFNGLILQMPQDQTVFPKGNIHEGVISTQLGTRGIPEESEIIAIQRDIEILRYAQSKLHFTSISTARSLEIIKKAKAEGLQVSCGVSIWQLAFTDESIGDFDIHYKFMPPLRTENDRLALIQALKDGTIDTVYSQHIPLDSEQKNLEFPYSKPGSISLQTAFALSIEVLSPHMTLPEILSCWTAKPRKILGITQPTIEVGQEAKAILFKLNDPWVFNFETNESKSLNSPLFNKQFDAKVLGIVSKGNVSIKA
jgi:dihydroorotase